MKNAARHRSIAMRLPMILALIWSSQNIQAQNQATHLSGQTTALTSYLTIDTDTIFVENGHFKDSLELKEPSYAYLKLSNWKWAKVIYLEPNKSINLDFRSDWISIANNPINVYHLNKDSILESYTATWTMEESEFNSAWNNEFSTNLSSIDEFFEDKIVEPRLIDEAKQMEFMKRAHRTSNFVSFKRRKEIKVGEGIYDFVDSIDLANERLAFHINNRNFQYFYYHGIMSDTITDGQYPFAFIDTVQNSVKSKSIQEYLITKELRSAMYSDEVNKDSLIQHYKTIMDVAELPEEINALYNQIQKLKPGNTAPSFGILESLDGGKLSLPDFKGKNLLISVWGSWCPFCKEELPQLKALVEKYPDKFESVTISLDTDIEKWKAYIDENDWKGTHLIDPDKETIFKKNYLISGTNVYYLISKDGRISMNATLKPSNPALESMISKL